MKRYFFGILAVVLAISATAFKTIKEKKTQADKYVFAYSGDYSVLSVQNESNWSYVGMNQSLCNNTNQKACRVAVIESYVNDPTGSPTLKTTANITATLSGTTAHVTGIDSPTNNQYSNQPD